MCFILICASDYRRYNFKVILDGIFLNLILLFKLLDYLCNVSRTGSILSFQVFDVKICLLTARVK